MFDRLRYAFFKKRHGGEAAELIERIEKEVAAIPVRFASKEWCAWLWELPPEAWTEALELKRRQIHEDADHEAAIRTKTQMNKLVAADPTSPEAFDAQRLVLEQADREAQFKNRRKEFESRYGRSPV